jgi:Na+/melibiose symporter-like transporter
MFKLVFSASTLVTGYMLVFAGFDEKLGTQPTATLVNLRLVVMLFPAVMAAIAALLAYKFPLTERRVAEYKVELDVLRRQRGEA